MRRLLACLVLGLLGLSAASAFEAGTQDVLSRMKTGKLIPIADVATLMRESERWCYAEEAGNCSWSDIYLEVSDAGATFEIGNAWNADYDVIITDHGTFEEGRYICETGYDWVPTLRAIDRADDTAVNGRPLWKIKTRIAERRSPGADCFDYILKGSDSQAETITLLQRLYTDGVTEPLNDVTVTLHFNADTAAKLGWY